jgi:serine O-acetyltransferase
MATEPKRYRELEATITKLVDSYDRGLAIDNLESAALPNKRAVIEAMSQLEHAIYLGFYSRCEITRDNLRHSISEHMYAAYRSLVDHIERALQYEYRMGRSPAPPEGGGEAVVLALFDALPELRRQLNLDVVAAFEGDPAARSIEEVVFSYPSIQAITSYRVANQLYRSGTPIIPRILSEAAHARTGIDINPGAQIGDRFFIDHGTGVVIGETAVIGNDVKLYQGVTLGALSVPQRALAGVKRHPTLEDNVTIYAGATILGGETVIGAGSVIGGNAWLVRSIPPGSKVFGRRREDQEQP